MAEERSNMWQSRRPTRTLQSLSAPVDREAGNQQGVVSRQPALSQSVYHHDMTVHVAERTFFGAGATSGVGKGAELLTNMACAL